MTLRGQDINDFWSGDTRIVRCTVVDTDGAPVNCAGGVFRYQLSVRAGTAALITKSSTAGTATMMSIDGTNDGWEWTLDPADTAGLNGRAYYHEAELTDVDGNVSTIFAGTVNLETDQVQ